MKLSIVFLTALVLVTTPWHANTAPKNNIYLEHGLVSDLHPHAEHLDPNLVNPWGIASSPTGPFWISDNGTGLDPSAVYKGPSLGMVGMRARARQIGGELRVDNQREGGLKITAEAPVQAADLNHVEQENPSFVG